MTTPGYPQGHALLIGVANYQNVSRLPAAVLNDVQDVAQTLSSPDHCGYSPANVVTLLDGQATRTAVIEALEVLASKVGPEDTACVYFSGHGAVLDETTFEGSFLLTVDSDLANLPTSAVSSEAFANALMKVGSKKLLVFVDACHAGGASIKRGADKEDARHFKSGYSEMTFAKLATGGGRALMASCRNSEESAILRGARNSVFTAALLEGLRGAANKSGDEFIRVFDLFDYVSEEVPKQIPDDQHPVFFAERVEGNFPVALSRGGMKSPGIQPRPTANASPNWSGLEEVLVDLYPSGPKDQEIWSRAGGNLSRLPFQSTGAASWHAALRMARQGGGGKITFASLLAVARGDFENNPALMKL
jgi:hypothetical protein